MKAVFLDIDNTLLSFDGYVKQTMKEGFEHFWLKPYEPYMFDIFIRENTKLWRQIEQGTLVFEELEKIRWNIIFKYLDIAFDGTVFEKYFRGRLFDSAIPEDGAYELLEYLKGKYILCVASNGPGEQQVHRLEIAGMKKYFDYIFVSERIGASKPSKVFFERAFVELNAGRKEIILPEDTVMIGDSLTSDIAGGLAFGMEVCLFRRKEGMDIPDGVRWVDRLEQIEEIY